MLRAEFTTCGFGLTQKNGVRHVRLCPGTLARGYASITLPKFEALSYKDRLRFKHEQIWA